MKKGRLIVFEGVDAAGKSSICAEYVAAYKANGYDADLFSFPGKTPGTIGELIYRIHHNKSDFGINDLTEPSLQTLHIAAHLDTIERNLIPALESGKTIILDRYWWSTWVYGILGGVKESILNPLISAEKALWNTWRPHRLFHVTRTSPLRVDSHERWADLKTIYDNLCHKEKDHYPILEIKNEGTLSDAVKQALLATEE